MSPFDFIILLIFIFTSAFLSASEVALFSLTRFQLRNLKENFGDAYLRVRNLLADPSGILITILVCNEIVNISISTLIAGLIMDNWDTYWDPILNQLLPLSFADIPVWIFQTSIGLLITLPIVVFFCEMGPKSTAARINFVIASALSKPLYFVYQVCFPIRLLALRMFAFVNRLLGQPTHSPSIETDVLRQDEFIQLVEQGHREGNIQTDEFDLIRNVLDLDDTKVEEICVPIDSVASLPASTSIEQALLDAPRLRFFRIPLFDNTKNKIVGILNTKDLIQYRFRGDQSKAEVRTIMREPFVVPYDMKINRLFRLMRQNHVHLALVNDAKDNSIGIVTLNAILSELFDDVFDSAKEASK